MSLRRVLAVTGMVTLTAGLVACGGDDGDLNVTSDTNGRSDAPADAPQDLGERLRIAEQSTKEAGAATVDITMDLSVDGEGFGIDMNGVADLSSGAADLNMTFDIPGLESSGLRMVSDGTLVWATEDSATWYEIDAAEFDASGNAPTSLDAGSYLDFLADAGGEIEEVGTVDIDGTPTTHYRTDVDVSTFLAAQNNEAGAEALAAAGVDTLPVEVFIGEEDQLVRRVAIDLDAEIEGSAFTMDLQADYSDFGESADITTPPAGEILPGSPETLGTLLTD